MMGKSKFRYWLQCCMMQFFIFVHLHNISVQASLTIEMPSTSFCELDAIENCKADECVRYDPYVQKNSPSIFTMYSEGGVGRRITSFITLLWLSLDHGFNVFIPKETKQTLSEIFVGQIESMRTLEDSLCDYKEFGFQTQFIPLDKVDTEEYKKGMALALKINLFNPGLGWWKLFEKYKTETKEALKCNPEIENYVATTISLIAKKTKRKRKNLTFVGIHARRLGYKPIINNFDQESPLLEVDYYQDAMEYYREEYGEKDTIFLLTSDDMIWARGSKELQEETNLYFVGCGTTNDLSCVGQDFAFLASCNHTIISHGTFGQWAGYLAGGEMYTEYGALNPDSYQYQNV